MRSSVSYILSSSVSEPNMSHPDYEQYSHDHAALLVLIKHVGNQLKPKSFGKYFDRINKVTHVKITDSTGLVRNIIVRYVKEHPVENNDWGDFQTHRRLLGLISIGKYDSQQELNEICRVHESLKVKYNSTLFDSRCIFFGPSKQQAISKDDEIENKSDSSSQSSPSSASTNEKLLDDAVEKFETPSNFKTRALFYDESGACIDLESQLGEFINSLFWVLESKRLERSREKLERVSLLLAPFEKRDFVGLDMESRNSKKRCTGRMLKHLGDLCLQAGLLQAALSHYSNAADTLKSVNDWLWLAAAYEGLAAASALVLYPEMQRNVHCLHRNASLQEGSPRKSSLAASQTATSPILKIPNTLPAEDIAKRYREAVIHYSKYQNAGIIETEASFKAARIAVEQNHALQAASFLQNVVYINLTLSEQEKIQRFETLADLYSQIGFNRKAAFCLRLAATRYVSPQNQQPNWGRCYALMLQSLPGHRLLLDPVEMRESDQGWPALQIQLLQELVVAAKRTGHSAFATRHMTFLLQTMWQYLTAAEQKELAMQLQSLSAQCEGSPVPLVLDTGLVLPPANLTDIPICTAFIPKDLQPHLRPKLIETIKQDTGPFLFTPIHFGGGNSSSLDRKMTKKHSKLEFHWVENELCEVQLKLINPLPFELKVANMLLINSGIVFESVPETIILPPEVPTLVNLSGWARENGELELSGYSTHTLGVKSNCRLKDMTGNGNLFPPSYKIDIVPPLPQITIETSLPQSATFSSFHGDDDNVVASASTSLFHGESITCQITVTNSGQVPIEMLQIELNSGLDPSVQDEMFKIENISNLIPLPLNIGESAKFSMEIFAYGNFLSPVAGAASSTIAHDSSGIFSSMSASLGAAGGGSLPSRFNSSFRSSNSGQSSLVGGLTGLFQTATPSVANNNVEAQLKLRYSGGGGLQKGFCRSCSVFIVVDLMPSLHVTNWDVLPAEISEQFYLVLDVANLTNQEMELKYTTEKTMLIEGQESCRVPIPVDRCPFSKLSYGGDSDILPGADVNKICSQHIAEQVNLNWHLLATENRGKASLKGLSLSSHMLDIVRMSPLIWDIQVNENAVKNHELSCEAGDAIHLKISVTNSLEMAIKQLTLSLQFYQDYENGTVNHRMDTRLAMTGCNKKTLSNLEPKSACQHQCNVIFFTPGVYKMDIECSAPDNNNFSAANGHCSLSSSQSVGIIATSAGNANHIWRFTPPITVQVN